MFADVTSANIVGYTTTETNAPSFSFGSAFTSISNGKTWKLRQIQPEGVSGGSDYIQFLETENASVYLMATYYSVEEVGEEWAGWCNKEDEDEMLDDLELSVGTAFLTNFEDKDVKFTVSGAVPVADASNKIIVDIKGQLSPFVCNPLPRTITLGEIEPEGMVGGSDYFQFLETQNASVYLMATYYSVEEVGEEWAGWCNKENEDEMLTDIPLAAGEGILGNIGEDSTDVILKFPSAL